MVAGSPHAPRECSLLFSFLFYVIPPLALKPRPRRIKQPVGRTRDKAETFAILHALFRSDLDSKASRPALYSASPDAAAATTAAAAATTAEETLRRELSLLCSADRDDIITCDVPGGDSKGLGSPPLRGVRWRVLLGALSRDCRSWACDVADQRGEFRRFFFFPPSFPPRALTAPRTQRQKTKTKTDTQGGDRSFSLT